MAAARLVPWHRRRSATLVTAALLLCAAAPAPAATEPSDEQVRSWRRDALAYEHGDGLPRDPAMAVRLYCRAARHGDAESQYNLAWMLANGRGVERDDVQAAHLFAAAAEQGLVQAQNMARAMGTPRGARPPCLVPPEDDPAPAAPPPAVAQAAQAAQTLQARPAPSDTGLLFPAVPTIPPANAPPPIINFVELHAPDYRLEPQLVLAVIATESNFNPLAVSPKRAQGLMQLIPETASRFRVRDVFDPVQNMHGGMAYLRWLMAYFEGDVALVAAAYNAGEGAVERWRGVPPYAETRSYVRRIMTLTGYRTRHPFDPRVTQPSGALAQIRPR